MNDPSPALQRLGAALDSGNRDAVMACFSPDASVDVLTGHKRMAFTGKTLAEAVDKLLAGFDKISLTPNTRQVVGPQLVVEAVLSGSHTGSFAGAEPTQGQVHVIVKLTATAGPDANLTSLRVDSDTRALFAQIADSGDIIGVGGRLLAGARERHSGVRVIDAPRPPAGSEAPAPSRRGITPHVCCDCAELGGDDALNTSVSDDKIGYCETRCCGDAETVTSSVLIDKPSSRSARRT